MTPAERGRLQAEVLDSIRRNAPGGRPSNTAIGDAIGTDRSEVCRFEQGTRRLDLDELVAAADAFGAVAVLGPIAERFDLEVRPRTVQPSTGPRSVFVAELAQLASAIVVAVIEAEADGRFTDVERGQIWDQARVLAARAQSFQASMRVAS